MSTQQLTLAFGPEQPADPIMLLELTHRGPMTVVTVSGEVDTSNAHLLTELVEHVVREQPLWVVLDMARVTLFSAAGITALVRSRRAVTATGAQLLLREPSAVVVELLRLVRMARDFPNQPAGADV